MSERDPEDRIRLGLRISAVLLITLGIAGLAAWLWPHPSPHPEESIEPVVSPRGEAPRVPDLLFTDITASSGIDFVHRNGAFGDRLLPETMGGGVAFLDYDNDGNPDLFFVNATDWPWRDDAVPHTSKLYRGNGDGTFSDVSTETGVDQLTLYGMGIAAGDYDGDGFVDVFITAVGENRLLRNQGGRRFEDVTFQTGVAGESSAWSTGAAFVDYDRDGDLDLVVCNYIEWSREIDERVDYRLTGIGRAYGPPTDFAGTDSYLYRNDGERGFVDVSESSGLSVRHPATDLAVGKGLAVLPVDVDGDGWTDLVVANDTVRNFLFFNRSGQFEEHGISSGIAFDSSGLSTGAMGIDASLVDEDLTIAIGNFAGEMTSFYVEDGGHGFTDDAVIAGIGAPTRRALTFGLLFLDVDLDGLDELFQVNGHVEPEINRVQSSQHYRQPPQLFWQCGADCPRSFYPVPGFGGGLRLAGRGAAHADIDGDGDLDLILTQVGDRPVLLRNDIAPGNHYLRIRLESTTPNTTGIGALIEVHARGETYQALIAPTRSYLSQVEAVATLGLAGQREIDRVVVHWPEGETEYWPRLEVDATHVLRRGTGTTRASR